MTSKDDVFGGEPFEDCPYVQLTDSDIERLQRFASRLENIRVPNADTFKCPDRDIAGFGGELAFSRYYGLDYSFEVKEGGDSYDFEVKHLPTGQTGTIDVKTITYGGGDMLIQDSRELTSDVYFLVEKRSHAYGLIGYYKRSEAAQAEVYPPGEYSPTRVKRIRREALHDPPDSDKLEQTGRTLSKDRKDRRTARIPPY